MLREFDRILEEVCEVLLDELKYLSFNGLIRNPLLKSVNKLSPVSSSIVLTCWGLLEKCLFFEKEFVAIVSTA